MGFRKIYTTKNHLETQKILDALAEAKIPVYAQEQGAGQYTQIITGMRFIEKELYVAEEDVEKASLLIHYLTEPISGEENPVEKSQNPWDRKRRVFARLNVIILIVIVLLLIGCKIFFE